MEDSNSSKFLQTCLNLQDKLKAAFDIVPNNLLEKLSTAYSSGHELFMQSEYAQAAQFYEEAYEFVEKWSLERNNQSQEDTCSEEMCNFKPFQGELSISFDDIVGLEQCKNVIREVLIYRSRYPHLTPQRTTGVLGIMLFGYPGCGKSLLAQARAAEINAPFYNVQLSQLQSKYRGESENRVRLLFQTLRQHDVAVLFLDEFDAITGSREAKDQMVAFKNELLVEMSGVNCNSKSNFVVVLAATNIPETVDAAFLSRFRYKLFVPLPTPDERMSIVQSTCCKLGVSLSEETCAYITSKTTGYSGRDIVGVLESLKYIPMRKTLLAKHFKLAETRGKYVPTCKDDEEGFADTAIALGLENIIRPPILEDDVLQLFKSCVTPRQEINMGMMQFARRYCAAQHCESQHLNEPDSAISCCVTTLMCCFWGK